MISTPFKEVRTARARGRENFGAGAVRLVQPWAGGRENRWAVNCGGGGDCWMGLKSPDGSMKIFLRRGSNTLSAWSGVLKGKESNRGSALRP